MSFDSHDTTWPTQMSLSRTAPVATLPLMPVEPAFQVALGHAVKARRKNLGLTQEQVSLRSDLHQRWLSNVETGKRNPSYASLRRLANALELTTAELIANAETAEAQGLSALAGPKASATRS